MKVGDVVRSPCGHEGRIVWISEDGKTVAVKCMEKRCHYRVKHEWGRTKWKYVTPVYIVEASSLG